MTVIIEDGDEVITTVIHKAYNLMTHVNHRDMAIRPNADGGFRPLSKVDFLVEGVAVFDQDKGNYLETTREKKDVVNKEARDALAAAFQEEARHSWWDEIRNDPERAGYAVDLAIKLGWRPSA
jgi:hypothetical protein